MPWSTGYKTDKTLPGPDYCANEKLRTYIYVYLFRSFAVLHPGRPHGRTGACCSCCNRCTHFYHFRKEVTTPSNWRTGGRWRGRQTD